MDLELMTLIVSLVLGLTSIFLEIWVAGRFTGKLRKSVIFLIVATAIFVIEQVAGFQNFSGFANISILRNIAHISIIFFILLAVISMRLMIDGIDHNHKKKK